VRLVVCGSSGASGEFEEKTYATSANAHGALIGLSADVQVGQTLFLMEPRMQKKLESRVVRVRGYFGIRAQLAARP
jgi:hypothetical protein